MRRSSKVFLALGVILWLLSYTEVDDEVHGFFKPVAAIMIILAYIANFLPDQEYEQFEEDQHLRDPGDDRVHH